MSAKNLKFSEVSFSYDSSIDPVISSLNVHFSEGWTGIVGPNGSGKSTIAKLAAGILNPVSGKIIFPDDAVVISCPQETERIPESAEDFIFSQDSFPGKLRSMLGINDDWIYRWNSLSHGERKRLQIGTALSVYPEILILDEPVNHVDGYTKRILMSALRVFKGIGILICHDRFFLDSLCDSCLFVDFENYVLRPGNFTQGCKQQLIDDKSREKKYLNLLNEYKTLKRSSVESKNKESGRSGSLSKKKINKNDHDAKSKIDGARLTGKDKTGMRKAVVLEKRAERIGLQASGAYFRQREIDGITFKGEKAERDFLLDIDETVISMGPVKTLKIPDLKILPSDRISIKGNNGSGKSTFLNYMLPFINIPQGKKIYIPQEIESNDWVSVRNTLEDMDSKDLGMVYTAVHRLGSEPERIMQSEHPSPGEKRKIIIAIGLLKDPFIIIMDEPTNHMDINSIQCLENAILQFTGSLVIVSHDDVFINKTTDIRWQITGSGLNTELVKVKI